MKKLKLTTTTAGSYFTIVVGAFIYGAAVGLFLDPYAIAPGGITGIAIIINKLTGLSVGALAFILNIPLIIAAFLRLGRKIFTRTLVSLAISSAAMDIFLKLNGEAPVTDSKFLSSIAGGALMAFAVGIIFKAGGTTGGSDIAVKFLRKKYPHIKSGIIFLLIDGAISCLSGIIFKSLDYALYALCALFAAAKVLDFVLYGSDEAKLVFIFTEQGEKVADKIIVSLDAGLSFIHGNGGYTGQSREIIMCAIKKQKFNSLSQIVRAVDPKAFMIVCPASEIYGEGFKSNSKTELL